MVATVEPVLDPDPVQGLVTRLEDPAVAGALLGLLDHADLLNVLVLGLHEFLVRGDTITDSLSDSVREIKAASRGTGGELPDLGQVVRLVQQLSALTDPLIDTVPTIDHLLRSDLGSVGVIDLAALVARAAVRGAAEARADSARVAGVVGLVRMLKDDDVARALGMVHRVLKAVGQELQEQR